MDYRRFTDRTAGLAVLVPERPRPGLLDLLSSVGVDAVWREGEGFADTADGRVT
jgi:hypothetical protein